MAGFTQEAVAAVAGSLAAGVADADGQDVMAAASILIHVSVNLTATGANNSGAIVAEGDAGEGAGTGHRDTAVQDTTTSLDICSVNQQGTFSR